MENASNALVMAGSVLIGVIVISLFVYLFSSMGSMTKEFQEDIDYTSIQKFNEQFEKYIGRTDINTHELLTVYNLVQAINKEAGEEIVKFKGLTASELKDLTKFLSSGQLYRCDEVQDQYNVETGKIKSIEFKKVNGS